MLKRPSVLITGARGYIGGRLVQHLVHAGFRVAGTTRGVPHRPPGWPKDAELMQLDPLATDPAAMTSLLRGVDCVVHLAAANESRSAREPDAALAETGSGTRRLLASAVEAGCSRFIFLSTIHVYGAPLSGVLNEANLLRPTHPYAITHLVGEAFTTAAHLSGQIEGITVRLSNGIGAPAWLDVDRWTLLGNDLARQAVGRGRMELRTPNQWRDFIALVDVCRGIELLVNSASRTGTPRIYNLGSGEAQRIVDVAVVIAEAASTVLGREVPLNLGEDRTADGSPPFEFRIDALRSLGFTPSARDVLHSEMVDTIRMLADEAKGC